MNNLNLSMTDESHCEDKTMNNTHFKDELFDADIIFENAPFLEYIITHLQNYLRKKLKKRGGKYICYGNENLEDRWLMTETFCEMMGIHPDFISILSECLDHPDCEGDFLNDFSVQEVIRRVHEYEKDHPDDN